MKFFKNFQVTKGKFQENIHNVQNIFSKKFKKSMRKQKYQKILYTFFNMLRNFR